VVFFQRRAAPHHLFDAKIALLDMKPKASPKVNTPIGLPAATLEM
jgi:hypothetical protein